MNKLFRENCMLAVAVAGGTVGEPSPLQELPLERFIAWVCNSGGTSIKIPTLAEVIEGWEVARHLGDSNAIHQLWLKKRNGGEVTLKELSEATQEVRSALPESEGELVFSAAAAMLLEPKQIRPPSLIG